MPVMRYPDNTAFTFPEPCDRREESALHWDNCNRYMYYTYFADASQNNTSCSYIHHSNMQIISVFVNMLSVARTISSIISGYSFNSRNVNDH